MVRQPDDLVTERLILRRPLLEHARAVCAILRDDRVLEHNPSGRLASVADAEALIGQWLDHWDRHGFGNCCVVERSSGRVVGNCGVRRMTVHGTEVLNLMVRFEPGAWGQGYATEAAAAAVAWAQSNLPHDIVLARIRPSHHASQAVARKLGLTRDEALDDVGADGLDWAFTNRSRSRADQAEPPDDGDLTPTSDR